MPVLPEVVKLRDVERSIRGTEFVPVGIAKRSLRTVGVDLSRRVALPVALTELQEAGDFAAALAATAARAAGTVVVDCEQILPAGAALGVPAITADLEEWVRGLFADMVLRHNTFKDAKMDMRALDGFDERIYLVLGMSRLISVLTDDGREKLSLLLEKAESFYKLHFVIVDAASQYGAFSYETWYKRQCSGDSLWIGDGIADQYLIKVNKLTSDLYEEIGYDYGYMVTRGRPELVKLLSARSEEETDG